MLEKAERIREWLKKKKVGPFLVEIWPTNRCNLRCIMCGTWINREKLEAKGIKYNPQFEMKNEISDERLLKLVEEAVELGTKEFLLTGGGEPFMRKNLTLTLMQKIKDYEKFGNLNTNGTLLNKKDLKKIVEMEWDMIMFSVDAPDAKTHDYIRGKKKVLEKVKENLLELKRIKKRLKTEKPKIVFNTVLTNLIYNKIDKFIKFAGRVGCSDITFIPLIIYDEKIRKIELNLQQKNWLKEKINELIKLSKKFEIHTNLSQLEFFETDRMNEVILNEIKNSPKDLIHAPCYEPFLHFLVKANGEATFCCMIENSPENIKEKSLKEIWFGDYFSKQRRNFINKNIRNECKFCVFSQFIRNKKIREMLKF
jgi:MoaA/NifB/PqqE/SkfB family radical SAM enzyme